LRFGPHRLRGGHDKWRREYQAHHVTHAAVTAGSLSCDLLTADVDEYCKVRMCWSDTRILSFLIERLRPGDDCWDIGASIGVYAVLLGKAVGPNGRVICFEPEPRSFGRIKDNATLNQLTNIEAFNLALGSQRMSTSLFVTDSAPSGTHSLFSEQGGGLQSRVTVEVYPGDLWRKENARPAPAALKVDVEGFEEEVLTGLSETLRDARCRTVLCEVHFAILEANGRKDAPAKLEKMLQASGFRTSWIDFSHLAGRKA
jgi:FkbM family methyltransferase